MTVHTQENELMVLYFSGNSSLCTVKASGETLQKIFKWFGIALTTEENNEQIEPSFAKARAAMCER